MGLGGIGIWQLLIVFAIVVMLFGTKKLRSLGGDLGSAIKGFKSAVNDDDKEKEGEGEGDKNIEQQKSDTIIDVKAQSENPSDKKQ